jgi:hypothetical protein
MQTIHAPQDEKRAHHSKMQESTWKDVERYFGVLQSRFGTIANPCRLWSIEAMKDVMLACVILHNMIIEDERSEDNLEPLFEIGDDVEIPRDLSFQTLVTGTEELENLDQPYNLKGDLVKHLWTLKGKTTY